MSGSVLATFAATALFACSAREAPPAPRATAKLAARAPTGPPDLVVDCNGGADTTTIQAAIARAPDRGWIEVHACTYNENLDYLGKSLWIQSTDGAAATVIDAGGNGPAVTATRGEGDRAALVGFHLDDGEGEAVLVDLSAMRLQDVVITDTDGAFSVHSVSGDIELANVIIDDSNQSWQYALSSDKGGVSIKGGAITCGTGEGLFLGHGGYVIDGVDIDCPGGGGTDAIEIEHSVGRIQRSTLVGDIDVLTEEDHDDDVIYVQNVQISGDIEVDFGSLAIVNSVVSEQVTLTDVAEDTVRIENTVFTGNQCAIDTNVPGLGDVRYNDFSGGAARCDGVAVVGVDGNFAANPMFTDPAAGDLHPLAGSPLIDGGVPGQDYGDVNGTRNDVGVYGGHFTLDGGW